MRSIVALNMSLAEDPRPEDAGGDAPRCAVIRRYDGRPPKRPQIRRSGVEAPDRGDVGSRGRRLRGPSGPRGSYGRPPLRGPRGRPSDGRPPLRGPSDPLPRSLDQIGRVRPQMPHHPARLSEADSSQGISCYRQGISRCRQRRRRVLTRTRTLFGNPGVQRFQPRRWKRTNLSFPQGY